MASQRWINPLGVEMQERRRMDQKSAEFQRGLAGEQWKMQKQIYNRQVAGAGQVAEGLQGLIGQYNTAYGEAKAANESRYQELLGNVRGVADVRSADIQGEAAGESANMMQRLARLGLSNTTIGTTQQGGINRRKQQALDRSKLAFSGEERGIIERRQDDYPSSDMIMQLVSAFGQGGGGAAAGGIMQALGNMRQG